MSHSGPHHGIGYGYADGFSGWGAQSTADLTRVDALLMGMVKNRTTNTPPASPSDGEAYIVGPSPTGAWAAGGSKAGQIANYDSNLGQWVYYSPAADATGGRGWVVCCKDEYRTLRYNGSTWFAHGPVIASLAPTLQAAIDSLGSGGGEVELEAKWYTGSTAVTIPTGVKVRGQGTNQTIIQCTDANTHIVKMVGEYSELSNLTLLGPGTAGTGCGIFMQTPSGTKDANANRVSDVRIASTASWSIKLAGGPNDPPDIAIFNTFENVRCELASSGGNVYIGQGCTNNRFYLCTFVTEMGYAAHVFEATGNSFENCGFERTGDTVMVRLELCFSTTFNECWFETHNTVDPPHNFMVETYGAVVATTFSTPHIDFDNVAVPRFLKTDTNGPVHAMLFLNPFLRIKGGGTPGTTELWGALAPAGVYSALRADIYCQHASDEIQLIGGWAVDQGYAHPDTVRLGGAAGGNGLILGTGQRGGAAGALKVPVLTTGQRDALPNPYKGLIIYNASTDKYQGFKAAGLDGLRIAMTDDDIIDGVLAREGGVVDRADDAGGPTNMGITLATYREVHPSATVADLRALTLGEAHSFYRWRFIYAPGFDIISDGTLRAMVVDCAVLHGVSNAVRFVQAALGAVVDGVWGPDTRARILAAEPHRLALRVLAQEARLFGRIISGNMTDADKDGRPDNAENAAGWLNRLASKLEGIA